MSVQIRGLKKSFLQGDTRIEVLKNLNAEIETSELVAIVGRSGSGKSTLLSLLAGLEPADSGAILINGHDLCKMNEIQLTQFRAQNIAIVFQQFHLVAHLTALENVTLPLEIQGVPLSQARAKAQSLLQEVQLEHRMNHSPAQLSGGECQRVAIARALIVEPQLLLADEPSGNLDTQTGDAVMKVFFDIVARHKITTLLVTHSPSVAAQTSRSLTLDHGVLSRTNS